MENVTVEGIGVFLGMGGGSGVTSTHNNNVNSVNVNEENKDVANVGESVAYDIRGTNVVRNLPFTSF